LCHGTLIFDSTTEDIETNLQTCFSLPNTRARIAVVKVAIVCTFTTGTIV
jgi:hypothetical protein